MSTSTSSDHETLCLDAQRGATPGFFIISLFALAPTTIPGLIFLRARSVPASGAGLVQDGTSPPTLGDVTQHFGHLGVCLCHLIRWLREGKREAREREEEESRKHLRGIQVRVLEQVQFPGGGGGVLGSDKLV